MNDLLHRGVGRGTGGHVPLRNSHAENFLSKQYRICDIQSICLASNVQHVFRFLGGDFAARPYLGLPCWKRNPLFCPLRNKVLATSLLLQVEQSCAWKFCRWKGAFIVSNVTFPRSSLATSVARRMLLLTSDRQTDVVQGSQLFTAPLCGKSFSC